MHEVCQTLCYMLHILQGEKSRAAQLQGEIKEELERIEAEKAELLQDNQCMAKLLASSEGDRKEVGDLLERLSEERKDFQRQCKQFRDKGKSSDGVVCAVSHKCPLTVLRGHSPAADC